MYTCDSVEVVQPACAGTSRCRRRRRRRRGGTGVFSSPRARPWSGGADFPSTRYGNWLPVVPVHLLEIPCLPRLLRRKPLQPRPATSAPFAPHPARLAVRCPTAAESGKHVFKNCTSRWPDLYRSYTTSTIPPHTFPRALNSTTLRQHPPFTRG